MCAANLRTLKILENHLGAQKELKSINNFGVIEGSLRFFDAETDSLKLEDAKQIVNSLVRKLIMFFTKKQSRTSSIVTIGENLLSYSSGLNYNEQILDTLHSLSTNWALLNRDLAILKSEDSSEQYNSILPLVSRILENAKMIYGQILSLESIKEHSLDLKTMESEYSGSQRTTNMTAINILKKIKQKLEGQDTFDGSTLTVSEQVDFLVKEATSEDNLSQMFEGWMAWI